MIRDNNEIFRRKPLLFLTILVGCGNVFARTLESNGGDDEEDQIAEQYRSDRPVKIVPGSRIICTEMRGNLTERFVGF